MSETSFRCNEVGNLLLMQISQTLYSADQSPPIKELVEMGLVPIFINFLQTNAAPKLQFEAAWVLTNICSGTSEQTEAVVRCGAVPLLIDLLQSTDEELAEQVCSFSTAMNNTSRASVLELDTLLLKGGTSYLLARDSVCGH